MPDWLGRVAYYGVVVGIVGGLFGYAETLRRTGLSARDFWQPLPGMSEKLAQAAAAAHEAEIRESLTATSPETMLQDETAQRNGPTSTTSPGVVSASIGHE
jgi:hypothetical protein